ncbi:MAG: AMP-binding protein [Acidobacteriia bacterium]|nr:AMP-binding protein [Terriglobia bacterium]MYG03137.1 AMP-binding protein [Terriglobia bacterium]MYK11888.1 AMP-binding protein [Terriglobia bacterium]
MSYPLRAPASTIAGLLAGQDGSRPALHSESGARMSYGELRHQAERTAAALSASGIGPGDPVAMVLENGPHMAAAFVAVAATAAAAPLHPGLREREFRDSLESLRARALIVAAGSDTPAAAVAQQLSIPTLQLEAIDPGGGFRLVGGPASGGDLPDAARPEDTALLLHTSGTTAKPKLVPLTQGNLAASAGNIASTLRLGPEDTCLNIMPLFHIHGLIGALLSSLCAGASVAATPGFAPMRFFKWLDELRPTWYSAVPTMHQAILQRSARNPSRLAQSRLRLIRSSSAALPPSVLAALEEAFGCPVVESYGMTEASHQMASNPLPPAARKPGTVGLAAGPEVAIMDDAGSLLPAGATGEVVIRGANVMAGYVENPQANASAFHGQWFRTGDQGLCDSDGYFTITGRLKELINRGGEKISPREIDEALLEHPAVAQAVAFAVPHAKLGEEIAAAVVLEEGSDLTQRALGQFASERLAAHKVPRVVRFVEAIPKGPSGKLKRVGLAKDLGLG